MRNAGSPFDGNLVYWSERNSKLYDGTTSKVLKRQNHTCGQCGYKLLSDEKVHLHHIDGNHQNWKPKNLTVLHESCHDYNPHEQEDESLDCREPDAGKQCAVVRTDGIANTVGWSSRQLTLRRTTYLNSKEKGDKSLFVKREVTEDVYGTVPQRLSDMAKS